MRPYDPQDLFPDPILYDLVDLVKGGDDGDANMPLKVLFNQTFWLFNRQGIIIPKIKNGNYTYQESDVNVLFCFHISANSTFSIADVTTLPVGSVIRISTRIPAIKALTVKCFGTQKIYSGAEDDSEIYMHDGESIKLVAASSSSGEFGDHWEVMDAVGNFFTAGQELLSRKLAHNATILDGTFFNRADMPRMTKFALSLPAGAITDDITWNSNPGGVPVYRGLFSTGNGSTTLRKPDDRGLFNRNLDLGRGLDNDRFPAAAGGYADDAIKSHSLTVENMSRRGYPKGSGDRFSTQNNFFIDKAQDNQYKALTVSYAGKDETRPKSIGKISQILY